MPTALETALLADLEGQTPLSEPADETAAPAPDTQPAAGAPPLTPSVATDAPDDAGDDEPAGSAADQLSPRALLEAWDAMQGTQFGQKYRSDAEFMQGMSHLSRRIGERDLDAEVGREFRQYQDDFRQYLAAKQQGGSPPAAQAAAQAEPPPTPEQVQLWAAEIARDGENADPGTRRKYAEAQRRMQDALLKIAYQPEAILKPWVDQAAQVAAQQAAQAAQMGAGQQIAQQQEQLAVQNWAEKNKEWLFHGGDPNQGFTPQAVKFCEYFDQATADSQGQMPVPKRFEYATRALWADHARAQQQQQKAAPPAPRAQRKPSVAQSPKNPESYEERLEKYDLFQHLMAEYNDQLAAGGAVG